MLFDSESFNEVSSLEDFCKLYETAWSNEDDAEKLFVAYRALIAAEMGSREDYLSERIKLDTFDWGSACDGGPAFFRLDSGEGVGWTWVLETHLSIVALTLAYEIEESSWGMICPDVPAAEREAQTLNRFLYEIAVGEIPNSGTYGSAFMEMMCGRIRQVIASGSKDMPVINYLISRVPQVQQAYAGDIAAREAQIISQVVSVAEQGPKEASVIRV